MAAEATELKAVLETLLSPDNATRAAGEAQIAALKTATPIPLVRALLVLCGDWCAGGDGSSSVGAAPCIRSLAAVLLRRHLLEAWGDLDDATRSAVRSTPSRRRRRPGPGEPELAKLLGDCVGALAQHVGGDEGAAAAWPELPPALLAAAASQNPSAPRRSGAALARTTPLGATTPSRAPARRRSRRRPRRGRRRRAAPARQGARRGPRKRRRRSAYEGEPAAAGGRAPSRPTSSAPSSGRPATPRAAAARPRTGASATASSRWSSSLDAGAKAFRDAAAPVLSGCLDVAATPGFGGGARSLAVAESVNDLESLKKTDDVPLLCGAAGARRKLNGKRRRRDWVDALLPFATQYPVACVRCAALDALAQSCEDLGPLLQLETHAAVVPALCENPRRREPPRARARPRAAARCSSSTRRPTAPSAPTSRSSRRRQWAPRAASPPHVREHAVAAVAALAEAASYQSDGSTKVGLYGLFGPLLSPSPLAPKSPLATRRDATAAVRARALETVALLGEAAGRDVFGDDAVALLRVVIRDYFGPDTRPEDDAERTGALKSVVRVAKCLGASFAPFLEDVLPYALEAAEGQQVLAGVAGDDDDSDADENDEFVVRTEALEAQANGCQSVLLLADALGGHFAGAVEKCFLTLAPLVSHAIADDVRSYAAAALPALVDCARLGDGANAAAALLFALEALLAAVAEEEDLEPLLTALQATKATIEAGCRDDGEAGTEAPRPATAARCRPLLLGTRLAPDKVLDALHGCLAASLQRRAVRRAEATMDEDYDDDAREAHEEAAALDGMVVYNVAEALGAVLRTHGASAFDALKGAWLPRLADMADERCVEHDRRVAAFVLCDVVEFGPLAPPGLDDATRARVLGEAAALVPALLRLAAEGSPRGGRRRSTASARAASSLGPSGHFSPHAPAALASIAAAMALRPSDAALAAGGARATTTTTGDDDGPDAGGRRDGRGQRGRGAPQGAARGAGGGGGQAGALGVLPAPPLTPRRPRRASARCADLAQPGLLGAVPLADKVACVARCAAALRENAEGTTARVGSAQKSGAPRRAAPRRRAPARAPPAQSGPPRRPGRAPARGPHGRLAHALPTTPQAVVSALAALQ
ncbi:secretory trafficking protein [Aureococcus anophagefferens]|uniref:Secretory trafficking protein n=1 Tax=Aureococcus anophagefferens TaxID=44056 RepID=A0ABR1FJ51_AURAN